MLPFIAGLLSSSPFAAEPEHSGVDFHVAERITYDDNLFRLPDGVPPADFTAGGFRRSDYYNRASLGVAAKWLLSSQEVNLDLIASDNTYDRNDDLDHVSGNGRVVWDWRTAGDWSGHAGADYDRSLASFANTRVFVRDLLDTFGYFGDVRYGIGSRWALRAGGRHLETTHSATVRQLEDFHSNTGTAALEYLTPASTLLALDFRHTEGSFPRQVLIGGEPLQRDYAEDAAGFRIRYALTGKTIFDGTAGYLRRDYENVAVDDYSGDVWRLAFLWQPGVKIQVALNGWREIKAYADAESDYFKATGISLVPVWAVREKLKLQLAASWERQDYIGSNPVLPDSARRDTVAAAQFQLTYLPRRPFELTLTYRRENRDSNRPGFEFEDGLASLGARFTF